MARRYRVYRTRAILGVERTNCGRTRLIPRRCPQRYAYRMRKHYTHRKHTNLTGVVPEKDRLQYAYLIKIAINGECALTPAFQRAIDNAAQNSQRQS